jgi:hypothetical protein
MQTIKWFWAQMAYKSEISTIIPNLENQKFLYF